MTAASGGPTRSIGGEEELLLVEHTSGRPFAVARTVIDRAEVALEEERLASARGGPGGSLGAEFKKQQVETDTPPRTALADVEADLRHWRRVATTAARQVGARAVASGTSPTAVVPEVFRDERYEAMTQQYGITAREQLTCGCHVHVSVEDDDEGVQALNGIRVWLPVLLAFSANSPFWQGQETGYASFRTHMMARWPATGPCDLFASGKEYRAAVETMIETGVVRDEGMVYFDARLSARYPTLEVRVADVLADVRDTAALAALSRALVDTAVAEARSGVPPTDVPTRMLRLATWQASRDGLAGTLLDPHTCRPRPAAEVVAQLLLHVEPALAANGDLDAVRSRLTHALTAGTGAQRQHEVLLRTHRLPDVVADLARVTADLD